MREKQNIEQNTTSKWKEMKKVREQRSEEGETNSMFGGTISPEWIDKSLWSI